MGLTGRVGGALPVSLLAAAGIAAALGWTTWMSAVVPFGLSLLVGGVLLVRPRGEGDSVLGCASSGERTGRYAESSGLAREDRTARW